MEHLHTTLPRILGHEYFLQKLGATPLNWSNILQVRDRLLLVLRFFHLMRSVDCARLHRTVSFIGQRPFIAIQRKGWTTPRWEELISLPSMEHISPWHLLKKYVHLTHGQANPGQYLFLSQIKPYKPLSADTLGSLTKKLLQGMGLPNTWGAHSTRGAAVAFYKK